jgi:hypothetical protein
MAGFIHALDDSFLVVRAELIMCSGKLLSRLHQHVFLELKEPNRAADVDLLKIGKVGFVACGCNGQVASGANGVVEAVGAEPVRKVRRVLGEHDDPLSELD